MAQGSLRVAQGAKKAKAKGDLYSISYDLTKGQPKRLQETRTRISKDGCRESAPFTLDRKTT